MFPDELQLSHNKTQFVETALQLQQSGWVTRETSDVCESSGVSVAAALMMARADVEANFYKPNANFFLSTSFHVSVTPAGRYTSSAQFKAIRIDMFGT